MSKKYKKKHNLPWEKIWESWLYVFLVPSIANKISTNVIYQEKGSTVRSLMWELFLFYYGRNKDLHKEDLVFIVPEKVQIALLTDLYGKPKLDADPDPRIKSFLGIEIKDVPCLGQTILLVSKKWSNVIISYEFSVNNLNMLITPAFENRWGKAILHRGR